MYALARCQEKSMACMQVSGGNESFQPQPESICPPQMKYQNLACVNVCNNTGGQWHGT
jgi:hypothetical protein